LILDDTITISAGCEYGPLTAAAQRTLIINPDVEQRAHYKLLEKAFDTLVSNLKIGEKISVAYERTLAVLREEKD
jgi:Xaa-Pro aminopeptidase